MNKFLSHVMVDEFEPDNTLTADELDALYTEIYGDDDDSPWLEYADKEYN